MEIEEVIQFLAKEGVLSVFFIFVTYFVATKVFPFYQEIVLKKIEDTQRLKASLYSGLTDLQGFLEKANLNIYSIQKDLIYILSLLQTILRKLDKESEEPDKEMTELTQRLEEMTEQEKKEFEYSQERVEFKRRLKEEKENKNA